MHADLVKLLELQNKDSAVEEIHQRWRRSTASSPASTRCCRGPGIFSKAPAAPPPKGFESGTSWRLAWRATACCRSARLRLEHVRNPKEAATLMAELDLARSVMAKEETEWVRSAEAVGSLELRWRRRKKDRGAGGDAGTGAIDARGAARGTRGRMQEASRQREDSASRIDRPLRTRYDRLRRSRSANVVVPLLGGTCGSCHTWIPSTAGARSAVEPS